MEKWNVTENNGGGLTLNVWDNKDNLIYIHAGYQHNPGQLSQDIRALCTGSDPIDLDDNEISDIDYDNDPSTHIIADGDNHQ